MDVLFANRALFMADTKEFAQYIANEEARRKLLTDLCNQFLAASAGESMLDDNVETFGCLGKQKIVANEDEKENFLMPAPKGRPPRNRKRNTKDALEDVRMSKSSRVTRSSKTSEVIVHETQSIKKMRKTKSSVKKSLMTVQDTTISILEDTDTSMTRESRKGRRTTRKGKENPAPRVSTRSTRASTRNSSLSSSKRKSFVLELRNTFGPKRLTRSNAACTSILKAEVPCSIPKLSSSNNLMKNTPNSFKAALFSPYGKNSVKERVDAFEGLSSASAAVGGKSNRTASTVSSPVQLGMQHSSIPVVLGTPNKLVTSSSTASSSIEIGGRMGSPLISSKNKKEKKKMDIVVEPLEEEADNDVSEKELEGDVQFEEMLDSPDDIEKKGTTGEPGQVLAKENKAKKNKAKKMFEPDEHEADDEWMTDDEGPKTPKNTGENSPISSSTPKVKASASKASQDIVGSYKALRSRKVKKSSDMSLTLSSKAKTPKVIRLVKSGVDSEFDLKRQKEEERQKEALRRKEELLKKRTEVTKKKREEKMSKVKRTREEREKEIETKKIKKAKRLEEKKQKAAVIEVEAIKTPVPMVCSPKPEEQNLNATFDVPVSKSVDCDKYNMTPHWQDVSPKQPNNPNDFGIADKSDCSSGEETDPRKKIPLWAQMKPNDNLLITQCLLPASIISTFWQSKPRAPTIQQFFGNKVSSKTLRRGLNYRTSSAMWNTPPLRN